jgi:Fe-S cluster assembly ATPase SufC
MNLEAYQEFLTIIRGMNLAIEQGMINTLLDRTPTGKSLPYDKIKNPQEFQHNKNRIIMNLKQSEEWMNICKPYEVEEKIQKICSVIKIPQQQKKQA